MLKVFKIFKGFSFSLSLVQSYGYILYLTIPNYDKFFPRNDKK